MHIEINDIIKNTAIGTDGRSFTLKRKRKKSDSETGFEWVNYKWYMTMDQLLRGVISEAQMNFESASFRELYEDNQKLHEKVDKIARELTE